MNIGEEASLYLLLFFIQDGNYRSFENLSRNDDAFFYFEESRNKVFLQLLTMVNKYSDEKMYHIFFCIEYIWMK